MANGDWLTSDTTNPQFGSMTDPNVAVLYGLDKKTADLPILTKHADPNMVAPSVPGGGGLFGKLGATIQSPSTEGAAEYKRFGDALVEFSTYTNDEITDWQKLLYAGGFYSSSYYKKTSPGVDLGNFADPGTQHAIKQALFKAAKAGTTLKEAVQDSIATRRPNVPTDIGDGSPKRTVTITAPEEVASAGHAAGSKVYGRDLSVNEINSLTSAYHQREIAAQTAANSNPEQATAAPSLSSFAEQHLRETNPHAAYVQNYADSLGSLLGAMGAK